MKSRFTGLPPELISLISLSMTLIARTVGKADEQTSDSQLHFDEKTMKESVSAGLGGTESAFNNAPVLFGVPHLRQVSAQ